MSQSARNDPEGYLRREGEHKPYEPVKATTENKRPEATAGDRECALQVMRAVRDLDAATRNLDIVEGLRLAHAAGDIIAAHCAAATAKERQARELAEGENARLRSELTVLRAEVESLRADNDRLLSGLEWLRDEQNGPPLETRRDQWQSAYDYANKLLEGRGPQIDAAHADAARKEQP